jgi:hypothetical protein
MQLPRFKSLLWATVCCVIAGFAAHTMVTAGTLFAPEGNPIKLESAQEPLLNGLRILETRAADSPRLHKENDETVLLLDEWTFTTKGKPSPYH